MNNTREESNRWLELSKIKLNKTDTWLKALTKWKDSQPKSRCSMIKSGK